ncbi:YtcA family lipoprotein [Edaphobacter albus]|uniref:YtcA family lipoprotein n=1 Tax=Edaphobacter sp. 4G125 TaxID=2763071 RepID=UPI001647E3D5|nr:YtcA family lipoprotein [Edaphobacter sp. 4G125]QNI36465.1 hypothetical protein H7846_16120 [Edaphobacter sp. 4G125]
MTRKRCVVGKISVAGTLPWLSGCSRAPSFNILGSFFPAWLFCIVLGITLAALSYWVFVRLRIEKEVKPSIVVYPCLAAFFAFTLWLILFR